MAAAPPQPPEGPITTEAPPVEMELDQPGAQVSEQGASVTFKLSQSVDIPSDGSPHKVTVASFDLVPRVDYLSVPKLAECAYRRLKLANQSEYLLLPGQANLFVEGDYVGSVGLPRVAPNEEFDLTLGVDDRVLVKRELKAQEVDKRMFQDRRRLRYGYEIELQNLRPGPIQLEVRDQAPVARHEQIKVKLEAAEPRPAEQTELNELIWRLTLEPGAKRVLRFDFSVEHPTGMTVLGLP